MKTFYFIFLLCFAFFLSFSPPFLPILLCDRLQPRGDSVWSFELLNHHKTGTWPSRGTVAARAGLIYTAREDDQALTPKSRSRKGSQSRRVVVGANEKGRKSFAGLPRIQVYRLGMILPPLWGFLFYFFVKSNWGGGGGGETKQNKRQAETKSNIKKEML